MAAVRLLGFWKLAVFIVWPLWACRYASAYKISTKLDNLSMNYGQKTIFKMAAADVLNFKNCHVTVTGFIIWCSVPNFIKIGQFFTEIWRFYDFQNGGRPPCSILKICSFCPVALVDLPFCFLIQNFAEIGQSVDDLWPKKRFSRWRPQPSWILKISIFGHVTVTGFNIWCSVPNFIKIGQLFTEIWRFNDF